MASLVAPSWNQTEEDVDDGRLPDGILNENEKEALTEFCDDIARVRGRNSRDAYEEEAYKFMLISKFDAARAFSLYQNYKALRRKLEMDKLDLDEKSSLFLELASGKITFLKDRSPDGCAIGVIQVLLHNPNNNELQLDLLLTNLLLNIDTALQSLDVQRNGLIFVLNLKSVPRSSIDRRLAISLLQMLQDSYPARIKQVFIVDAPWLTATLYTLIHPMLKKTLRKRVVLVSQEALHKHLSRELLPYCLGGTQPPYHSQWVEECLRFYANYQLKTRLTALRLRSCSIVVPPKTLEPASRMRSLSLCDGKPDFKPLTPKQLSVEKEKSCLEGQTKADLENAGSAPEISLLVSSVAPARTKTETDESVQKEGSREADPAPVTLLQLSGAS